MMRFAFLLFSAVSALFMKQTTHPSCANIQCGALNCPAGFSETKVEGHCCPYCFNPDVKLDSVGFLENVLVTSIEEQDEDRDGGRFWSCTRRRYRYYGWRGNRYRQIEQESEP